MYDFYYQYQLEGFNFYKIPKIFFTDEELKTLSSEAKILYALMLDRMNLSIQNGWIDSDKKIYIYYTIENITQTINCKNDKAVDILKELERKGLIVKKRQGLGKPNKIYVMNFATNTKK